MGISSSLNAGVAGLQVNSQRLSGISDNIANSGTYGYKRAETDFTSLVNFSNTATSYNAGGVRASTIREVSSQGSLISTTNPTDLTVDGRGLLPVTTVQDRTSTPEARSFALTSTGSFRRDDEGYLTTTSGLQLLGWPTDDAGDIGIVSRESAIDLQPVKLNGFDFAPNPTTKADMSVNLPSSATAGEQYNMALEYFDGVGNSNEISILYTSVDPTQGTWTAQFTDDATGNVVGAIDIDFATTGVNAGGLSSITATTGAYNGTDGILTVAGVDGPIEITIGAPGTVSNLTQYAGEFSPVRLTKNGSVLGFLRGIEMTDNGVLEGVYDTGFRRALFQVPVADIPNPQGLTPRSNQTFEISNTSGAFYLWDSGDGPTGNIAGYTREESTTDITEELTQLIQTQRAYSSNAKIVQTVDEMLQETTNLKR